MSIVAKELAIGELVKNVLETKFESFSQEAVEDAKDRFIDVVGCAMGGAYASGNSALLDLIRRWGGKEEATILVHGDKVPVHYAAMMNIIMCRSYDYEVCAPKPVGKAADRISGHICGATECTGLSVAELRRASGKELITAAILGGDLAVRVAVTGDIAFGHGFDTTGTVDAFGATAIAGRLMGLNKPQMVNAFGILVNEIAGSIQSLWDGVHTFKLPQGKSASNAIFSVELALHGFTGIKDPLFSPSGYFPLYCKSYHPEFLTVDLGKVFYTKGRHKLRPSGYVNHAAIECALEILRRHEIKADDITEVTLSVTQSTYTGFFNQPFEMGDSAQKALFNLPYGVANALLRNSTKLEHYTDEFVRDPKIIEFVKKVKVVPTTSPENRDAVFHLKVKIKDGREFSAHIDKPRGYPGAELTRDEIKNKYWSNVDFCKKVSRKNAEKVLAMLENLEQIDNVAKIVALVVT